RAERSAAERAAAAVVDDDRRAARGRRGGGSAARARSADAHVDRRARAGLQAREVLGAPALDDEALTGSLLDDDEAPVGAARIDRGRGPRRGSDGRPLDEDAAAAERR